MESIDPVLVVGVIALICGVFIGMLISRISSPSSDDVDKLKAELERERTENARYKASVDEHFNKTSNLVNDLTQDYVKVYRHLAEGAQMLSGVSEFNKVLEQPKGQVLISVDEAAAEAESTEAVDDAAPEAATETATDAEPSAEPAEDQASDEAPAAEEPPREAPKDYAEESTSAEAEETPAEESPSEERPADEPAASAEDKAEAGDDPDPSESTESDEKSAAGDEPADSEKPADPAESEKKA